MFEVMKSLFSTTTYTLEDAEGRIDYAVARGRITPEQAQELLTLAQAHAVAAEKTMEARMQAVEQAVEGFGVMETALNELGVETR